MKRQNRDGLRKICGCPVRTWPKCQHSWHFAYKHRGKRYRFSLDRYVGRHVGTKTEAREIADALRTDVRRGTFNKPAMTSSPETVTVERFGGVFVQRVAPEDNRSPSWRRDYEYKMKRLSDFMPDGTNRLGDLPLRSVTEDTLEAFLVTLRTEGRAVSTLNKYVQLVKHMFRWATKKGYLDKNPISEDSALKRRRHAQRNRRLRGDEEAQLVTRAHPRLQRMIVAALESGMRLGELLSLQWRDVDLERREIRILASKAKSGRERVVPISDRLMAVFEMARLDPSGKPLGVDSYVFGDELGGRIRSVKRAWTTVCKKTVITDLRFHDLRHEAGSRWLEAGVPLHHVQELLGHADLTTTGTYLNATLEHLHDSIRDFDRQRAKKVPRSPSWAYGFRGTRRPDNVTQPAVN